MESLYGHSHSDPLMSFALIAATIVYLYPAAGNDVTKALISKSSGALACRSGCDE